MTVSPCTDRVPTVYLDTRLSDRVPRVSTPPKGVEYTVHGTRSASLAGECVHGTRSGDGRRGVGPAGESRPKTSAVSLTVAGGAHSLRDVAPGRPISEGPLPCYVRNFVASCGHLNERTGKGVNGGMVPPLRNPVRDPRPHGARPRRRRLVPDLLVVGAHPRLEGAPPSLVLVALIALLMCASYCAGRWNWLVEDARHEAASAERIP